MVQRYRRRRTARVTIGYQLVDVYRFLPSLSLTAANHRELAYLMRELDRKVAYHCNSDRRIGRARCPYKDMDQSSTTTVWTESILVYRNSAAMDSEPTSCD